MRSLLFALAVSFAAAAQNAPPPLPGADSPPAQEHTSSKKKTTKKAKKDEAPPPLPGAEAAAPALPLPAATKQEVPALPLPSSAPKKEATPPANLPLPSFSQPAQAPAQEPQKAKQVQNAPVTPPSASPASAKLAGPAGASAPTAATSQPVELRLRTPGSEQNLWNVRGYVGGERSTESTYTDPVSTSHFAVEATRWFSSQWLARGQVDWRSSQQPYLPLHAAANRSVLVDENRFDVMANVGYDVGPSILKSGRLELTPMIGVHYMGIRNDAFPSDLIGANFTGRARFALSGAVMALAQAGYTYNFAVAKTQNSALKSPQGDVQMRAGLQLPLSGGYALELVYSGDVLSFENTYRVAHGAALGFGSTF